jgi:hypothetical protein
MLIEFDRLFLHDPVTFFGPSKKAEILTSGNTDMAVTAIKSEA